LKRQIERGKRNRHTHADKNGGEYFTERRFEKRGNKRSYKRTSKGGKYGSVFPTDGKYTPQTV
jgi:hypothetical protein